MGKAMEIQMSIKRKLKVMITVKMEMGLIMESFWGLMVGLLQLFVSAFLYFLPRKPSLTLFLSLDVLFLAAPIITVLEKMLPGIHWKRSWLKPSQNQVLIGRLFRAVCLGVSGVNHPTDQERILNWLREIFPSHVKLYVHNDAVAALASGTMGKLHGCVLIAGTGCISYGFAEDGREARASGAGPVLGDWGSGYGIAAKALTAVIRAHDGRGPQTMLTNKILKALSLSSPDELIGWTYADPSWARIAALVPEVVSCAEACDQVATKILVDAAQDLALSVKAVVQRLHLCGEGANLIRLYSFKMLLELNIVLI
ncbi:ACTIN-LIKE ATPASE SUPERFAMILY PROTEIN [Salix purpurea]|uniref:N-acetyl-D-glucosamine kinase n=1 Tax=Salix purpurea TaxID=77065 RepID=A0A9Q1AGY0_SALPP|nr:ACTIN-LIKE ATPASE SUPERFAMILY PROTEIN [Salix purpurea]